MNWLGNIPAQQTVAFLFSTHKADGTPIALTNGAVSVYKGAGTTESTTGVSLAADFDSVTGLNLVSIVTTDAFYAAGNEFSVVLTGGTVDSVSVVGTVLASFSIANRQVTYPADVQTIKNQTVTCAAGVTVLANVGTAGANTAQTGDAYALLGTKIPQNLTFASVGGTQMPLVDLRGIIGSAISETSGGYLAAGFKKLLDVAAPVFTLGSVNQTGDSYADVTVIKKLAQASTERD